MRAPHTREGVANFISAELAAALIKIDVLRRENDAGQLARKLAGCLLIYERHFEPIALARDGRASVAIAKNGMLNGFLCLFSALLGTFSHQHSFKVKFASPFFRLWPFQEEKTLQIYFNGTNNWTKC